MAFQAFPHPFNPTLGSEINPSPNENYTVGQRPLNGVYFRFGGELIQLFPGVSFVVADMANDKIELMGPTYAEVAETFSTDFQGPSGIRVELTANAGDLFSLSMKQWQG